MSEWPFSGLRRGSDGGYGAIIADPPWSFRTYDGRTTTPHRTEQEPYQVMSADDLKALPVAQLAAKDCVLFLWTVSSHMDQALALGEAWGFRYKSKAFEWLKTTKDGRPKIGMGHWTRQESETCLLFTRGHPRRLSKGVRSTIWAPPREHSRKPDEQYEKVMALCGGPYAELFAKYRWPGVDGWGYQYPDDWETEIKQQTFWLDLLGADQYEDGSYMLCERSHPAVDGLWPYCDDECIPL